MKRIIITLSIMIVALMCAGAVAAADADDFDGLTIEQPDSIELSDTVVEESNADENETPDLDIDQKSDELIPTEEVDDAEEIPCDDVVDDDAKVSANDIVEDENASPELSRYEKIIKFLNHDCEGVDPDDFLITLQVYDEILNLYGNGHPVQRIAVDVNMTPEQVQTIADSWYGEIPNDRIANGVYKLYGSHTLEEIADELGISTQTALQKIQWIKSGTYGKTYKRLFLVRDLISMNDGNNEFVIN